MYIQDIIHVPIATEESDFAGDASESDSENQSLHHSRSVSKIFYTIIMSF